MKPLSISKDLHWRGETMSDVSFVDDHVTDHQENAEREPSIETLTASISLSVEVVFPDGHQNSDLKHQRSLQVN